MPQRIISEEIKVRLGTAWIPASTMSRFVEYIVTGEETPFESKPNRQFGVSFVNAEWSLNVSEYVISSNSGRSRNRFGTERRDAVDLIEKVMNGSKTDVFDTIDGKAVFNAEASALASAKAQDLATEFKEWVWKNPQRKEHLEDVYNDKYGMIFKWIPMFYFQDRGVCEQILASAVRALLADGILFLVGPRAIKGLFGHYGLDCSYSDLIMNMPFFRQHLKICPENLINQDITVFLAEKNGTPGEQKESKAELSTPLLDRKPETQVDMTSEPNIPLRGFNRDE